MSRLDRCSTPSAMLVVAILFLPVALVQASLDLTPTVLSAAVQYDDVRASARSVTRIGSVDAVPLPADDAAGGETPTGEQTLGFCHLAVAMPFSSFPPTGSGRRPHPHGYETLASTLLAVQHLNAGDGSVVPEVEGLNGRCPVRFTVESFDTELSQKVAVDRVMDVLGREGGSGAGAGAGAGGKDGDDARPPRAPCAFIGNSRSPVSLSTSVITGVRGYPQFSPLSISSQLDDKQQHPYFGRTRTSVDGIAYAIIEYYKSIGVEHLGVVHVNDGFGNPYARALVQAAGTRAPDMSVSLVDIPSDAKEEDYERAAAFLENTQFRYFFAAINYKHYGGMMIEAFERGIAGTGVHNWMYSIIVAPGVSSDSYEVGSPLYKATRGILLINTMSDVEGSPASAAFGAAFKALGDSPADVEYLASMLPRYEGGDGYGDGYAPSGQMLTPEFFAKAGGTTGAFAYDAVISLGLAACNATAGNRAMAGDDSGGRRFFDGPQHFRAALDAEPFQGATGPIVLDRTTGTRDPASACFELVNFINDGKGDRGDGNGTVMFSRSRPFIFRSGSWERIESEPLSFNDGTPNLASDLPPVTVDKKTLSPGLRAGGLLMSALVLSLSIGFSVWTYIHRNTSRVVRASQPIFLFILCFGVFLMGAAIVPLSIDDGVASLRGCDVACMATPWAVCVGFCSAFSALFAKTWRINKVFQIKSMKRVKVTAVDVIKPLLTTLAVNFLLLSLWTALAPLQWKRTISEVDVFGRTIESHGTCTSNSLWMPYAIVLLVVNLGTLVCCCYQSYVAREISTEFAESSYIAKSVASCLLVSFVGVPVMYIVKEERSAYFFVCSSILFVLCSSLLLFIFVPKVRFHRANGGNTDLKSSVRDFVQKSRCSVETSMSTQSQVETSPPLSGNNLRSQALPKSHSGLNVLSRPQMIKDLELQNEALQQETRDLKMESRDLKRQVSELQKLVKDDQPEMGFVENETFSE